MKHFIFLLLAIVVVSTSCKDPIQVNLGEDKKELVIDALLNTDSGVQKVILTQTIGFFEPLASNPPISGATVILTDASSNSYAFVESLSEPGTYIYPRGEDFKDIGKNHNLMVINRQDTFVASTQMGAAPPIDNLTWKFVPADPADASVKAHYVVEFSAIDLMGEGNNYLVRSYKNDTLLNRENMLITTDGEVEDGDTLSSYVRSEGVNSRNNPFQLNDKVEVHVMGVSDELSTFLSLANDQKDNGGLFATPSSNVPSNFVNRTANAKNRANGFFVIGQSSSRSGIIQ